MQLIKVGGNELGDQDFLNGLAASVLDMEGPVIIVHGGGEAVSEMQRKLGQEPIKVDGLRVTNAETLEVSQMVLSGYTNKTIVAALVSAGIDALGISGVDGGLLRCVKKQHPTHDLGYVGQIVAVRSHLLNGLMDQGITPVISPISLGSEGQVYNVNADEAAAAIATSLQVNTLSFVSNVPAVLDQEKKPIPTLTPDITEQLIRQGIIYGGMVIKVKAALDVVGQGVPNARIVSLSGLANGAGTTISLGA
jgi:acetylglutamate kinase